MSQAPRNPFETGPDQFQQPQSSGTSGWIWVLGIIGAVFLIGTLACCGFGMVVWFQASGAIAEVAVEEFADDPTLIDKIGTIEESEMSFREAIKESSKDEDISAMVFSVKGDKGSGKIIHKTNIETGEVTATLVMESGEEFALEVPDEFADFEAEFEELESMEGFEDLETENGSSSSTEDEPQP